MVNPDVVRGCFATAVVAAMLAAWQVVGQDLLLFPEVGALAIGLLVMDKSVWRVSKLACLCVMTMAAAIGIGVSRCVGFVGFGVPVIAAFLLSGLMLRLTRIQLPPALAAAVMPALFGIVAWEYVGMVAALVSLVIMVQWVMELTGVRRYRMPVVKYSPAEPFSYCALGIMALSIAPLCVTAWLTGWKYLVAPPLLVTLAEFSQGESGFRRRPWQVLFMLLFGASAGAAALIFSRSLGFDVAVAGVCAFVLMLCLYNIFRKSFAPSATLALLALLVGDVDVWTYPAQVVLGGAYAILVSSLPCIILKCNK